MSLLSTKPRYFSAAEATERGWVNPQTGEVLVAIGNLKIKLEAESKLETPKKVVTKIEPEVIEIVETKEEIIMDKVETPVEVKRKYNKKPKVIGEVVEEKLETNRQIIGEVVEHDLDK